MSDMFGIVTCSECGRHRIIDLYDDVTKCPYCNNKAVTKDLNILFQDRDQSIVRDALTSMSGIKVEKKKVDRNIDPMSSLEYRVENVNDIKDKMVVIAKGLTDIQGTFTQEDVERFVPGKGEKYLKTMLDECMVYEVGYGRYRFY
ncbi:hypothetical protein [Candidatus Methanarcanum hacksteinii]|uniref:hypothetical protein n=1 Tax=Candidatus Methanarcanum hacksteinii TaxID=2911857 RepID=UPI0015B0F130